MKLALLLRNWSRYASRRFSKDEAKVWVQQDRCYRQAQHRWMVGAMVLWGYGVYEPKRYGGVMQVGDLVYDDDYGIGIVIGIEDGFHTIEFPEVDKVGVVDMTALDERLEVI